MRGLKWIWARRTRTLGYLGILISSVQLYLPGLGVFLSVKQMALTTFILSFLTTLLGHYNSWASKKADAP